MCVPLKKFLTLTFKENNNLGRDSFKTHQDETLESVMGKQIFTGSISGQEPPVMTGGNILVQSKRDYIEKQMQQTGDNPEGLNVISKQWSGICKWKNRSKVQGREHSKDQECSNLLPDFILGASQHVVARFAFISAGRAHVVVALEAARLEQVGIWDYWRSITLQLAVGFRERPEPVFKAGQPRAQSWLQEREAQDAQNRESKNKIQTERMKTCQQTVILGKSQYFLWSSFSTTSGQMFMLYLSTRRASTEFSCVA